jgi:cold shock protein
MYQGTISKVFADRGFGFIRRSAGSPDLFFHVRDLAPELPFDETLTERRVEFEVEPSDKGPRAIRVRAAL